MTNGLRMAIYVNATRHMRTLSLLFATLVLAGCATTIPQQSNQLSATSVARADTLSVTDVRERPAAYAQSEIIWGGTIEKVEHRDDTTWVEIIERPLNGRDQPDLNQLSGGRFIAIVPEFLDPADFRVGMPFTVDGLIEGVQIRNIGETAYDFPKIAVSDYQLWKRATRIAGRSGRYYRDDYYGYRSPIRTNISIGLGIGSRSSIRLGLNNYGRYYGGYGYNRYHRYGVRYGSHRGHRSNRRFSNGRSAY